MKHMADEKDLQEDIPVEDKEVVEGAGDPRRSGFSFWYFFFCEVVI